MKQVYSYQEIGTHKDQGREVVFTCPITARVTTVHKSRESDTITVMLMLSVGDTCIGIIENEYTSMLAVLNTFAIDDLEEMWEVLA
jgi:hypothetical protein